jgi:hypothetical protein
MMDAVDFFKKLLNYQTTRCLTPDDYNLNITAVRADKPEVGNEPGSLECMYAPHSSLTLL